ncbi:MAG: SMC-Scp complex subunit ScpB, partial [Verrucomicrobiales bacterium]
MELTQIVEALLIASPDPISAKALAKCIRTATDAESDNADEALAAFGKVSEDEILGAIIALNDQYVESGRAFLIAERASGWKIFTRGEFSRFARELFPGKKPQRLSAPAL